MRFLDANEMLCMLPADSSTEAAALDRLNPLFSRYNGDPERLPRLIAQGALKSAQINHEGKPVAVVWYRPEPGRMIVDTLTAVNSGRTTAEAWKLIWSGVEMIARDLGASCVEGITQRAALARVYLANGFEPRGVLMRKAVAA